MHLVLETVAEQLSASTPPAPIHEDEEDMNVRVLALIRQLQEFEVAGDKLFLLQPQHVDAISSVLSYSPLRSLHATSSSLDCFTLRPSGPVHFVQEKLRSPWRPLLLRLHERLERWMDFP